MWYTFLLTSLLGKIRTGANNDDVEVSSTIFDDSCDDELLSKDEFNIADCIWTLFFLSIGLRGGKTGGISWFVDPTRRPDCFCDDNEGLLDNKFVFAVCRCSSSYIATDSTVDEPCLFRPGFRLNLIKEILLLFIRHDQD